MSRTSLEMDPVVLQEKECRGLLDLLHGLGIAPIHQRYGPGDIVYLGDGDAGALYVLAEGVIKLFVNYSGSKEAACLLGPSDIFGHLMLTAEPLRQIRMEAATGCEIMKVPKTMVAQVIRTFPEAALKVVTLQELRLLWYGELLNCVLPRKVEVRLSNLFLILLRRFGEDASTGPPTIGLRLTQLELAPIGE